MAVSLRIDDHDFAPPLLTGADVLTMTRAGILPEGRGYELIEGVLVRMAAQNAPHVAMIVDLMRFFIGALPPSRAVAPAPSLFLSDTLMLEPDICLYDAGLASTDLRGADLDLVIEVADTTLRYDLGKKARLYAAHGVRDYWVIDLNDAVLHRHALSGDGPYAPPDRIPFGHPVPLPFAGDIALVL